MSKVHLRFLSLALAMLAVVAGFAPASAQVTTGALTGQVTLQDDGTALPGAEVVAVHVPTGTRYSGVTNAEGRFRIPNVRVGGPYTITVSAQGFQATEVQAIYVQLGQDQDVPVQIRPATIEEVLVVTGESDPIIDPNRTGSSSQVSVEQIESLPTVNRSLQDFARTNPYFVVDAQDASATRISVAGRNNRYNSIQIDGAVNNDLFGLADTGTPGGQTDTQPISLDAVEQLQLVVSPYDVRQGGFTGGGVNVVTRTGGNDFSGSIFGSQRDEDYVGDGPLDRPVSVFDQEQYGARLGGRIIKDKLFFFVSAELNSREQPTGVAADGTATTQFRNAADAQRLRDFLTSRYGYDPGGLGDFPVTTESDLAFARLDWNVNDSNQFTIRHNYVDAARDVVGERSSSRFRFPNAIYAIADETNSTVLQLNSALNSSMFNEARIGYQTIRDIRNVPALFPSVEIGGTGSRNGEFNFGVERFSGANSLDQDVLEITDDFTWIRGNHSITIGTRNEIFEFKNLFMSEAYGYYYYRTLAEFEAGGPAAEYRITFANGDDPRRPTQFEVRQYGLYAGDQWRVNDSLTLTYGLRVDMPDYVDTPSFNPLVQERIGWSTATTPSDDPVFSPRLGFNWDPTGDGSQQVRGGVGIFTGRTPYVWVSNAYGNTGVETTALSAFNTVPFNPDPFNQPRTGGASSSVSVDLIDEDFSFPRVLRTTLGYDRKLFWGIRGTAEVVWSQTQDDVFYLNVNRQRVGTSPLDGRPTFARIDTTRVADAILLTNTSEGEELTATVQLNKPFANGLTLSASYAYQDAESALDGTSSRAISNWQFRHTSGDIFEDDVARSAFEIENRFTVSAAYDFKTGPVGHTVALYYNAQSGRPYSLMMGGDPNTDGYSTNDLLFVPGAADAIILQDFGGAVISYDRFAAFLSDAGVDPTAGRILDRYELNEPWSRLLDFHYDIELPIKVVDVELTFDLLNVLNMIDSDKGVVEFVGNQNYTVVTYRGIDAATGKPIYRESFAGSLEPGRQFSIADSRSRWQGKVGLRLSF
jgi:outer membrane receptor protein involved in Fe transport